MFNLWCQLDGDSINIQFFHFFFFIYIIILCYVVGSIPLIIDLIIKNEAQSFTSASWSSVLECRIRHLLQWDDVDVDVVLESPIFIFILFRAHVKSFVWLYNVKIHFIAIFKWWWWCFFDALKQSKMLLALFIHLFL